MPEEMPPRQPRKPRWGIYTLGFLAFAFIMVITSNTQGHYTLLTFSGLVIAFVGAAFCTVKGLRGLADFRLEGKRDPPP